MNERLIATGGILSTVLAVPGLAAESSPRYRVDHATCRGGRRVRTGAGDHRFCHQILRPRQEVGLRHAPGRLGEQR